MNSNYVYADNTNESVPQKLIKQYNLTLEYIFERQLEDDYIEFLVDIKCKPEFADHREAIEQIWCFRGRNSTRAIYHFSQSACTIRNLNKIGKGDKAMNKTVNINNYRVEKDAGVEEFKNYMKEAVETNRDKIATLIMNGIQGETLIDTVVDQLISHAFSNYSKETLLKYMSNGVIITATQMLTDKFLNDKKIKSAIEYQMAVV